MQETVNNSKRSRGVLKRKISHSCRKLSLFWQQQLGETLGAWEEAKRSSVTAGKDHQHREYS